MVALVIIAEPLPETIYWTTLQHRILYLFHTIYPLVRCQAFLAHFSSSLTFFLFSFFSQLPSNLLLRRLGVRVWLSLCVIGWGAAQLGMGFVPTWGYLSLTRVFLGVFEVSTHLALRTPDCVQRKPPPTRYVVRICTSDVFYHNDVVSSKLHDWFFSRGIYMLLNTFLRRYTRREVQKR